MKSEDRTEDVGKRRARLSGVATASIVLAAFSLAAWLVNLEVAVKAIAPGWAGFIGPDPHGLLKLLVFLSGDLSTVSTFVPLLLFFFPFVQSVRILRRPYDDTASIHAMQALPYPAHFPFFLVMLGLTGTLYGLWIGLSVSGVSSMTQGMPDAEELSGVLGHDEDQSWRLLLTAQALVEMALSRTTEAMIRIPRIDSRIQEAMAHIDEHFGEALQNRAMASLVGLGQDSFIRLFKAQTGDTPRVYLRQKRIEQACLSLRFSEDSIEQIADDTGFCDRYHFTRVFRRVQGMGPATFRRVHRTRLPGRASESGLQAGRD